MEERLIETVKEKEAMFLAHLRHPKIRAVRSCGLMIAVEFDSFATNKKMIDQLISQGVFTDWFLFAANCLRIVPPLVITREEIISACKIFMDILNNTR